MNDTLFFFFCVSTEISPMIASMVLLRKMQTEWITTVENMHPRKNSFRQGQKENTLDERRGEIGRDKIGTLFILCTIVGFTFGRLCYNFGQLLACLIYQLRWPNMKFFGMPRNGTWAPEKGVSFSCGLHEAIPPKGCRSLEKLTLLPEVHFSFLCVFLLMVFYVVANGVASADKAII